MIRRPGANRRGLRMPPTSATAWTPADYAGVTHHWRADMGITDVGSGETSAWTDQVSGDVMSQAVSAMRPTLTTRLGQAALSFDGGDLLSGAFAGGALTQPSTLIALVELTTTAAQRCVDGDDALGRYQLFSGASWFAASGANLSSGVSVTTDPTPLAALFTGDASAQVFVDDFDTAAATGDAGSQIADGLSVGATFAATAPTTGWIWEVLIATGDDAASRASMRSYLADRYGI